MVIIHSTQNYRQFNFIRENRDVNFKSLLESVQKKNLLDCHPIICDEDLNVIDGQHRLKVAETLQVPIYYIISKTATKIGDFGILCLSIENQNFVFRTNYFSINCASDSISAFSFRAAILSSLQF